MESKKEISKYDCKKCGCDVVFWSVKNSAWYCSRCNHYRGEANNIEIVKDKPMSTEKQPPAELVEKMKKACLGETYLDELISNPLSVKCAQIAVKYAEEENRELREFLDKYKKRLIGLQGNDTINQQGIDVITAIELWIYRNK